MLNRKARDLAVTAIMIASALAGLSTTSASASGNGPWNICDDTSPLNCIVDPPHGDIYSVSTNDAVSGLFTFFNPYVDANGNTWWEIGTIDSDLCLNWSPTTDFVYADSCIAGDKNELWSNHPGYTFDNLAAALSAHEDAWLDYTATNPDLFVVVSPNNPRQWVEVG